MKTFLLPFMALFAMNVSVHAVEVSQAQEPLMSAEELSAQDGVNINNADDLSQMLGDIEITEMDDSLYPPHHPHPGHPGHPGHPHHPHPVPPPHHPHPLPPPTYRYECSSYDRFDRMFFGRGLNPVQTQRAVHNRCEYDSQGPCYDNGCRRIRF
jgi:hypothetical protein